jgi:hypothetical protein
MDAEYRELAMYTLIGDINECKKNFTPRGVYKYLLKRNLRKGFTEDEVYDAVEKYAGVII